jgi:hypothetical protein
MERYPLQWPAHKPRTPASERQDARFHKQVYNGSWNQKVKLSVADAVKRVENELALYTRINKPFRIPPGSVVISTNVNVGVRGKPLSSQPEPEDPGVAIYFVLDGKPYCFECDKWTRVADNLAAVAAHARALRNIEGYGVGRQHDVYTGFKALPEKASASAGAWWMILEVQENTSPDIIKSAYKKLMLRYHPDTGSAADINKYHKVQQAYNEAKTTKNFK